MRVIIVDDERFARTRILNLLKNYSGLEVVAECNNGASAIQTINTLQPDLVFLDINVRDMDGFQVLEELSCSPRVVFITAHDDFAVKAFDYEAFDYLVKPFSEDRFFRTMSKLVKVDEYLRKISVKHGNKTILVDTEQINYILASGVYAEMFTEKGKYVHRESLNNLEQQLNPQLFFRVHRSAIINLKSIKELVHGEYSTVEVRMNDNTLIGVSRNQKKAFCNKIKEV